MRLIEKKNKIKIESKTHHPEQKYDGDGGYERDGRPGDRCLSQIPVF